MKASGFGLCCVLVSVFCSGSLAGAFAADTNSPPRLTVELRDGSRVVGTCVEKFFKFHSALLGELKLEVQNIRSVECVSTNSAKLSTATGDSLTVHLQNRNSPSKQVLVQWSWQWIPCTT
jgi:hypothetical protein